MAFIFRKDLIMLVTGLISIRKLLNYRKCATFFLCSFYLQITSPSIDRGDRDRDRDRPMPDKIVDMGLDFYYMPMSVPCRAVLLAAKGLGVNLNLKLTNLLEGDHMKPEFLKINPQHTIPALDDNGFYLNESRPMIQYLANAYGKDETHCQYPKNPKERFTVDQRLAFDMGTLYQRFGDLYFPVIFSKEKSASLDPEKVKKLNEALSYLEGFLKKSKYAAGDTVTIADYCFAATLATIEAVEHDLAPFPRVRGYLTRLKEELIGYAELNGEGANQFGLWAKPAIKKALLG